MIQLPSTKSRAAALLGPQDLSTHGRRGGKAGWWAGRTGSWVGKGTSVGDQGGRILGSQDRKGRLWDGRQVAREGFFMGGADLQGPARAQAGWPHLEPVAMLSVAHTAGQGRSKKCT